MNRPREDGKLLVFFLLNYSYQCWPDGPLGTYILFYNIFYKNIEVEICEILRIILRIKPRLRFLKRIDIILCVEASVNTIQFSFVFLTVKNNPCWLTRSLLQWLHLIVLDIVETKSGSFVSIMLYLVSFDVTFRPQWLQRKCDRAMHDVTQYRSKYQTLTIDTPINSKTEMS